MEQLNESYCYDAHANRAVLARANLHTLPSDAYDATGNLTNHPHVGQMTYDGQNRLVRHVSGGTTVTLGYDAEGRRVKKDVSGVVTKFAYDAAGRLAAEYAATMPVDMCTRCFLTVDALGSTRLVTDGATGVVKQRRDYMPFGEQVDSAAAFGNRQLVLDGGVATYNATGGPRALFTGKERDAETGLDYFGARYMRAAQGRFTSPDAPFADQFVENPQSWNLYAYVRNNPLKYIDPTGRDAVACGPDDRACVERYAQAGASGAEAIGGAVKGTINGVIGLSNAINNVLDLAIAGTGLTDFRFGQTELLPMTPTEQVGAVIGDVAITAAMAAASLPLKVEGTVAQGTEIVQRAMSTAELAATRETGLVRGGREGVHFVSDAVNNSATRAQQRLALPVRPEVKATLEVPSGAFSAPTRVQPLPRPGGGTLPGGGIERTATGHIPARVVRVKKY
ncbi:MAG: RHS repeat-associated core domain-containing protein [Bryobacterales bacterium]|nr:RHS repeat-associated core domain-containing protein [Bryobacterales bacterium]